MLEWLDAERCGTRRLTINWPPGPAAKGTSQTAAEIIRVTQPTSRPGALERCRAPLPTVADWPPHRDIRRFKLPQSANYWGWTAGDSHSGSTAAAGSITKQAALARFLLRATGAARVCKDVLDATWFSAGQASARFDDRAVARDAPAGDDPLATADQRTYACGRPPSGAAAAPGLRRGAR